METRYNLKSPGEPGWGRRAGTRDSRRGASAGSCPPALAAAPGLALYARPRPVRGCRPQGGRPLRIPDLLAPLGSWPLPGLCGVKLEAPSQGQV